MTEINYRKIAELDPLKLDADLHSLPEYNAAGNTVMIRKLGAKATQNFPESGLASSEDAYAVLRDLDFIASSLDKHGLNPFTEIDHLEETMLRAGLAGTSIPRGTITTYAGANPDGERRRSFTGTDEETVFIDSLKISFNELEIAMRNLAGITPQSSSTDFVDLLNESTSATQTMTNSIVSVMRSVPPAIFTGQIRPYFEPLHIGGRFYVAANGSQLQLVGIEKMVYGTGGVDSVEDDFFQENVPYLNSAQRYNLQMFSEVNQAQDILSILQCKGEGGEDTSEALASLAALAKMIRKFRYPHRKVAQDNFTLRPNGAVGSGSYTPAILTDLIHSTEARIKHVQGMSA